MRLITHDNTFHYDEVLATAVLLKIYPNAQVTRTRDENIIKTGDIVYDVGRIYDPERNRYDHHQNTFDTKYSEKYNVKLSSAGLIYVHFHDKLFEQYGMTKENYPRYDEIVEKVYFEFFLPADAIDNGYDAIYGEIRSRTVADVVRNYNVFTKALTKAEEDTRFRMALDFVSKDLHNYLYYVMYDYAPKYKEIYSDLKNFTGDIFITEKIVSNDLLYELNEKLQKNLKFIIMKTKIEYRIITIPLQIGKFGIKYPLHKDWRGLSGDELVRVSGISGAVFVHASGFTGANKTLEGALEMCNLSLENQ